MIYLLVKLQDNTVLCGATETDEREEIVLHDARMIVYWDAATRGMPGLCSKGPGKGCRVSAATEMIRITKTGNVRFCARMTEKAWRAVEAEPWG